MPLGLWRKKKEQDRGLYGDGAVTTYSGSTGSSSGTPRVSTESESESLTSIPIGSLQWMAYSRTCFETAWMTGRGANMRMSDFLEVKILAKGSFGPIMLTRQRSSGKHYVIKVLQKQLVYKSQQIRKVESERRILNSIEFPFLVNLKCQGQDSVNLYLVMDYLPGGDLWNLMQRQKGMGRRFSEDEVRFYVSQVILALEYLHRMDIVYRDLKTENIFMDSIGYLKLGDFGCSRRLAKDGRAGTQCGTEDYMAPEIVTGQKYNRGVDYWSLGVLIYEMVKGETPFASHSTMQTYEKIVCGKYSSPRLASIDVKDLIQKLLTVDSVRRLERWPRGFESIKGHGWFLRSTFSWRDILRKKVQPPYIPQLKHDGDTKYFPSTLSNNVTPPHLFKQQESHGFKDYYDKYFENF